MAKRALYGTGTLIMLDMQIHFSHDAYRYILTLALQCNPRSRWIKHLVHSLFDCWKHLSQLYRIIKTPEYLGWGNTGIRDTSSLRNWSRIMVRGQIQRGAPGFLSSGSVTNKRVICRWAGGLSGLTYQVWVCMRRVAWFVVRYIMASCYCHNII